MLTALGAAYPNIEAALRHADISPWRRIDPGPALDVAPLTAALLQGEKRATTAAPASAAGSR